MHNNTGNLLKQVLPRQSPPSADIGLRGGMGQLRSLVMQMLWEHHWGSSLLELEGQRLPPRLLASAQTNLHNGMCFVHTNQQTILEFNVKKEAQTILESTKSLVLIRFVWHLHQTSSAFQFACFVLQHLVQHFHISGARITCETIIKPSTRTHLKVT